jgi:flagellar biogenesis protein FliO
MAQGLLFELVRTGLALVLVSALAYVGLRAMSRRGLLGAKAEDTGPTLRVLRRLSLGPRSSVFVVGVGRRVLVLGVGDGGAPSLIADLGDEVAGSAPAPAAAPAAASHGGEGGDG